MVLICFLFISVFIFIPRGQVSYSPHILPLARHAGSGLQLGTHDGAGGVEGSPRREVLLVLEAAFGCKRKGGLCWWEGSPEEGRKHRDATTHGIDSNQNAGKIITQASHRQGSLTTLNTVQSSTHHPPLGRDFGEHVRFATATAGNVRVRHRPSSARDVLPANGAIRQRGTASFCLASWQGSGVCSNQREPR